MVTQVTPFTFTPTISDPANFATEADGFVGQVPSRIAQLNTLAGEMNDLAADLVAVNLPDLTGRAGYILGVNDAETDATFIAGKSAVAGPWRNKIINGQFEIAQRGFGPFTSNGYTFDMWKLQNGTAASNSISTSNFALGQTDVPGNPEKYLTWARSSAGTTISSLEHYIEDVRTFSGKTITFTLWAKASAATELRVNLIQVFGSGGSASADVSFGAPLDNVSVGTSWAKYTGTIAVPSIAGKTVEGGDDHLLIRIRRDHNDTNPTATVDIANVSMVEGDATLETDPGAWRDPTTEFQRACRYYYRTVGSNLGVGRKYAVTSGIEKDAFELSFPVRMRAEPTPAVVTAPTYVNSSAIDLVVSQDNCTARVTATAPGEYRAFGGVYEFSAEL